MKRPENFVKINDVPFSTRTGNKYKFSVDNHMGTILWVFRKPDDSNYCLALIMDWENNSYQIKRAKNGDGSNWIDTIHSGNFASESIKTINSFVDWAHNRILQFEHNYNHL
jgi:hypothetical protein